MPTMATRRSSVRSSRRGHAVSYLVVGSWAVAQEVAQDAFVATLRPLAEGLGLRPAGGVGAASSHPSGSASAVP